jgi:hypothetical protein
MAKLNQIIAVEKGIKSRVYGEITELHKVNQKPALFSGFAKDYHPIDDAGEALPPERQRVQYRANEILQKLAVLSAELMDVTARKDWTNCQATADVSVDGNVLIPAVPVTYLLFLEKQLTDLRTFVAELPLLDEADDWSLDDNSGLQRTPEIKTHRTKKLQRPVVLYDATPEHPAQTQLITEDVLAGYWHQTKLSGAMPRPKQRALAERVERLLQAVKQAREAANSVDETATPEIGARVFDYLYE